MYSWKNFAKKSILKKISTLQKCLKNYPACKELEYWHMLFWNYAVHCIDSIIAIQFYLYTKGITDNRPLVKSVGKHKFSYFSTKTYKQLCKSIQSLNPQN